MVTFTPPFDSSFDMSSSGMVWTWAMKGNSTTWGGIGGGGGEGEEVAMISLQPSEFEWVGKDFELGFL